MTRERIEGWLKEYDGCVGTTFFSIEHILDLCTLALRGLSDRSPSDQSLPPRVEWVRAAEDSLVSEEYSADWGQFRVVAWTDVGRQYFTETTWRWDLVAFDENKGVTESLKSGTAPSLEAAQKAAEDALLKLVGGEG